MGRPRGSSLAHNPIALVCKHSEYPAVLARMSRRDLSLCYSFCQVKLTEIREVERWCNRIADLLGYKPGEIRFRIKPNILRSSAHGVKKEVNLGMRARMNLHVIIHEVSHLLNHPNFDIHGLSFSEYLSAIMEDVATHCEDVEIYTYTKAVTEALMMTHEVIARKKPPNKFAGVWQNTHP